MYADQVLRLGVFIFTLNTLSCYWDLSSAQSNRFKIPRLTLTTFEIASLLWLISLVLFISQGEMKFSANLLIGSLPIVTSFWFWIFFKKPLNYTSNLIVSLVHLAFVGIAYCALSPGQVDDSHNGLILIHVLSAILSITAFAVSGVCSILYLIQEKALKSKAINSRILNKGYSLGLLNRICLRGTLIGFLCFTISILIGIFYTYAENLDLQVIHYVAVGMWLSFGILLQARLIIGWQGKRVALLNVIAFSSLVLILVFYLV